MYQTYTLSKAMFPSVENCACYAGRRRPAFIFYRLRR